MRSPWTLNLILAALIVVLGAFIYFKPGARPADTAFVTTLTPPTVTRVQILRSGQEAIILQKGDKGWEIHTPVRARANTFNVEGLLRVVAAPTTFQTPVDPAALATYGLDNPVLRLQFNDEEIVVGALHPMKQQHYLRHRDIVHLVPSQAVAPAFRDYTAFIGTRLFEEQRRLEAIKLPGFALKLQDGSWHIEPRDDKISTDRLNQVVAEWENASALTVTKLAADKPKLATLEFKFQNEPQPVMIDVLSYKPEFILARRDLGLRYQFPEEIGKRLTTVRAEE